MDDSFLTLRSVGRAEIKVLGSRFLAVALPLASPVTGRREAEEILEGVRKEHFAASHHCFAWRLGKGGAEFRASDGGEPSGSAGKPILVAIEHGGWTDAMVIVTRYFGGTKLGIGGLVRSYGEAAAAALQAAGTKEVIEVERICVAIPHQQEGVIRHAAGKCGARVIDATYDDLAHLTLEVRKSLASGLRAGVVERTSGRAVFDP